MSFTKFASFEVSAILDVKGAPSRTREASLNKLADFEDYRTEDGYLYARIRAISSRVNKNHDGWPSIELAGGKDIFDQHRTAAQGSGFTIEASKKHSYGFSTFVGKPIFVDHHNSNPDRARGVIVDAKFHVEDQKTASSDPYYSSSSVDREHLPASWVELLLEVDAKSFPKFAKAILEGSKDSKSGIDGFSMGCDVEKSVCNICKNAASTPDEFCNHIRMKGALHNFKDEETGQRRTAKSYENCYGIRFFEISGVFDPADETALVREVRSAIHKEAKEFALPCPHCYGSGYLHNQPCSQCEGTGQDLSNLHTPNAEGGEGFVTPHRINPTEYTPADEVMDMAQQHGPLVPRHGSTKESIFEGQPIAPRGIPQIGPGFVECPFCHSRAQWAPNAGYGVCPNGHTFNQNHLRNTAPAAQPVAPATPGPHFGSVKEAFNPPPQADALKVPSPIDTLREEESCPVCGHPMEDGKCDTCPYIEPPEHFNNPDLGKATENQALPQQSNGEGEQERKIGPQPTNHPALSHVTGDMQWKIVPNPHLAGRNRPVTPGNPPQTNEPQETVVKDEVRPVTSHTVRTAGDMLTGLGRSQENTMDRVAENSATPADSSAQPDKRTDVDGVGGIMDASNEAASAADAQVDVGAKGGTGVENVEADKHDHVEHGNEKSKNIDGTDTDTWSGTGGNGVTKQESPVKGKNFPDSSEGVKKSHDDSAFPKDDNGLAGGTAVKGVKPIAENFGERQDVLQHSTSPANNSGPTDQWTGTDGNGVTKQQDPVTNVVDPNIDVSKRSGFISISAVKLAELEIELGLTPADQKYARLAELGEYDPSRISAELAYAERVRTAGLHKQAKVVKEAKKLPVLGRQSSYDQQAIKPADSEDALGGTLFGI